MRLPGQFRGFLTAIRALRDRCEGVAAIEFSLIALPFFFLLFVILETGYFFLLSMLLENASAEGARQIRTGIVQKEPTPDEALAALKKRVCDTVYLIKCNDLIFDVRSFTDFSDYKTKSQLAEPDPPPPPAFDPGDPGSTVIVSVKYNWSFMTPLLGSVVDTNQMIATVAFRNEPF